MEKAEEWMRVALQRAVAKRHKNDDIEKYWVQKGKEYGLADFEVEVSTIQDNKTRTLS